MKTRFKLLRQELGMTQEEFGSKIGVARNTIAQYESGRIVPSNPVITNICKEYAVNETWLLTGEGNMFKDITPSEEIESFLGTLAIAGDENFKKRLILYLAQMKDSDWQALEHVLDTLLAGKDIIFPPDTNNKQN
jgi:transcriptional regulator with XRE-family HTH domain